MLIQSRGETWREVRNGPVMILGAIMVVGMILALLAYHLIKGGAKLEHRTGPQGAALGGVRPRAALVHGRAVHHPGHHGLEPAVGPRRC